MIPSILNKKNSEGPPGGGCGHVNRNLAVPGVVDGLRPFERSTRRGAILGSFAVCFPPFTLVATVLTLGRHLQNWLYMWVIAWSLFFASKWITIGRLYASDARPALGRLAAYIFLWPGMNARAFCASPTVRVTKGSILRPISRIIIGAVFVAIAVHLLATHYWLASGWIGMIGIVLILHFGLFDVLAIIWGARHPTIRPLMRAPLASTSLAELRSRRWNTAFTDLMHAELFIPISRKWGTRCATFTVFLVSGILHELVISVPARGGYGLPTAYFLLQYSGVIFERSSYGVSLQLGRGIVGWIYVFTMAALPAFFLFPPIFVRNVIMPMLQTLNPGFL